MIHNIPPEFRALPQWVVASTDKIPLNPVTGARADATNPATWGTFEQACGAKAANALPFIGFVLSKADPFCVIDLDDPETKTVNGVTVPETDLDAVQRIATRHKSILESFATYAEISQSGKGVHIVCRAIVASGARRDRVEVYSDSRYIIFTGNVIKPLQVAEQQANVNFLWAQLKTDTQNLGDELEQIDGEFTDEEVFNMASTASNSEKFLKLWKGEWQGNLQWPSQSEADYALLAMLAFYSVDNEQCRRMFRLSGLAREKTNASNYHLDRALRAMRAKTPPPVNFETALARGNVLETELQNEHRKEYSDPAVPRGTIEYENETHGVKAPQLVAGGNLLASPKPAYKKDTFYPPGFVGDLAKYFFESAPRPVAEIALAAAIGLTAGIVGRSYNISSLGLNCYIIVLATTGAGKDALTGSVNRMVRAARAQIPTIDEFIGPRAFASGQAMTRVFDKSKCFVSVMGEIGFLVQRICSPNANNSEKMLKEVLLDLYMRSGKSDTMRGSVYSDSDKNTKIVDAPALTILGESNPETFYNGLDVGNISEGLIPRFSIIEYSGLRPRLNENAHAMPSADLLNRFCALAAVAMTSQQSNQVCDVKRDAEASVMLKAYGEFADDEVNGHSSDVIKQLWSRAHLKALRLSALIAVGQNPYAPLINAEAAQWAIDFTSKETRSVVAKFENGEVGMGDMRLELDVRRTIKHYLSLDAPGRIAYGCPVKMAAFPLVPLQFLRRRCRLLVGFKADRRGATMALKMTLAAMVEAETLALLSPMQAQNQCGTTSPVYGLGPSW